MNFLVSVHGIVVGRCCHRLSRRWFLLIEVEVVAVQLWDYCQTYEYLRRQCGRLSRRHLGSWVV
jgi:hypothetical protein